MSFFVRLQHTVNSKGDIVPLSDYQDGNKLRGHIASSPAADWYTSLFYFPQEAKSYFEEKGTIRGYKGPAYCNGLVFDFDSKADVEVARNDVRTLLKRLSSHMGSNVKVLQHTRIFFSGKKGFHVQVKTDKAFTPDEMKLVCSTLAEGLSSFDTVIYNSTRLYRIENTKHQETGLFKIPVDVKTLVSDGAMETIKRLAKAPLVIDDVTTKLLDVAFIDEILVMKPKSVVVAAEDIEEVDGIRGLASIDWKKSKGMPRCMYMLSQGHFQVGKGHRNHIMLHLGNYWRNKHMSKDQVHNMLKATARMNKKLYPEHEEFSKTEIWTSIISRVFSDEKAINDGGWGVSAEDPIFAGYCKSIKAPDCKCIMHDKKADKKDPVVKIGEVANDFNSFATNFEDNVIKTGIKFIDEKMKIAVGTTTLVVGSSGTGKTTMCLNMMENCGKQNLASIFFSMDMNKNLVYLKLSQRHTNYTQNEIFDGFKNRDQTVIDAVQKAVKNNYENTYFDFSSTLSIDDMVHRIKLIESRDNVKIKLVVVDYASRIQSQHSDNHAAETQSALMSNQAAADTDAAWIILNQISRAAGDGSTPLRSARVAKSSSAWEESATNVLTIWRPFLGVGGVEDPDTGVTYHDQIMTVYIAKNRMGLNGEANLLWDGAKGLIRDMDEQETEIFELQEKPKIKMAQKYKHKSSVQGSQN